MYIICRIINGTLYVLTDFNLSAPAREEWEVLSMGHNFPKKFSAMLFTETLHARSVANYFQVRANVDSPNQKAEMYYCLTVEEFKYWKSIDFKRKADYSPDFTVETESCQGSSLTKINPMHGLVCGQCGAKWHLGQYQVTTCDICKAELALIRSCEPRDFKYGK